MRLRLGECARRKAMEHFDEQMVIRRTIEVYDELLPGRRAAVAESMHA